jgi:ppGpp synthetase/RelA/SpoT-type nucleotidyltranferase
MIDSDFLENQVLAHSAKPAGNCDMSTPFVLPNVEDDLVEKHLKYLHRFDPTFRQWWDRLSRETKRHKRDELRRLNQIARIIPSENAGTDFKQFVDDVLADRLSQLPDWQFSFQPDPEGWIRSATDQARSVRAYHKAIARVELLVAQCPETPIEFYGGVKCMQSVRNKIGAFKSRAQTLDLWDTIRVRLVANDLAGVQRIATELRVAYGRDIKRFRNFYVHPRNDKDLYRAIHLIVLDGKDFVEIQVMTASREIVCELDHAVVFKWCLDPIDEAHVQWLRKLSLAANVRDATS